MNFLYPAFLLGVVAVAIPIVLHLLRRDVAPAVPFTAVRLLRRSPVERSRRRRLRDVLLLAARVAALLLLAAAFARPYSSRAEGAARALRIIAVDRSFSMGAPGRFAHALDLARGAIDEAGFTERVAVIAFDERADVLALPGGVADARAALTDLAPGNGATRYAGVLEKASELAAGGPARLVIVSDLQRAGWDGETRAHAPASLALDIRDAGAPSVNVAAADVRVDETAVVATVRNASREARQGTVMLAHDGVTVARVPYDAPPEASVDVRLPWPGTKIAASGSISVTVDDPGVPGDNSRHLVLRRTGVPTVMIVTSGDASGFFLLRALDAAAGSIAARAISGPEIAGGRARDVAGQAALILLSTRNLDRPSRDAIVTFVRNGGGLLIVAAPEVEPGVVASMFGWDAAAFTEDPAPRHVSLAATDARHPIFRPFAGLAANLGQVNFHQTWRVRPDRWHVPARFSDGSPAVLDRTEGAGKVVLFASDVDRRWNDFPLHPAFVPFAVETVRYLAARRDQPRELLVSAVPHAVSAAPGIHKLADGRPVAVNVDPRESSIAVMTAAEFAAMVDTTAATAQPRRDGVRAEQTEARQNLWQYGLMLMLLALVTESFVGEGIAMTHLSDLLARVRRRWFATVALRTIGLAAAAAALPALAAVLLDGALPPEGTALILLAASAALLSLMAAALVLARIGRRPDDRRVARFVEERAAGRPGIGPLDDAVVSAVDAWRAGPDRTAFTSLIVASAMRRLDGVTPADLVTAAALRRAGLTAVCGVALLATVVVAGLPSLTRAVETARLRLFPHSISVEVLPGTARIVAGRPLKVRARIHAGARSFRQLQPVLVVSADSDQRAVAMVKAADGFEFQFESVDRTFRYQVKAGGASSPEYTVTALFPPRVQRIDLQYRYPSFSGLSPRDEEDGGDIYAPAGTRVRVRIHADKAIASGQLSMGGGVVALRSSSDRSVDADLVLSRDDSYRVRLADRDGLSSDGDSEYFIRLMDDRPPDVRILRPSTDQGITPLEEVTIEARADDDYGVSTFELVYSVAGGPEHTVPFSRIAGTPIQKRGSHLLAAEELKVKPGDVITYYARARDVGRGKRSTETKSDMFFLEVKPFSEEFVAAQSQAGAGASGDPQLDSLISAQKEIISATWNVERRSEGGRSAADVAAIARAQGELKTRAERIAASSRGRRFREPAPQRIAPPGQPPRPGAGEGVAKAIDAMTRAIEQLGTQRTREALSHEMAALNGLLQAQAEVRRRQVTQQANGSGSGGGNRSGQDLSALFDKELQRQQRTNYEQRSQVEDRPDQRQTNDEALDRIKELARRQEELNRRRRDLETMSGEERKRELDKLTRDQMDLRQQAEELARQRGQPSGLRDAAEQMRAAAGDMRREDSSGARQSGQRAADQLRRIEQQMRSGSADSGRREGGELQREAQQIAHEQRRIAAEADRLEKGGESTADARRRLAGEKERLADRVDELQRAARRMGAARSKGEQTSAAREAAADLERQRVADRMRESAQQMRGGKQGGTQQGAVAEQQIARALDQVVEKLGGAASSDARKLSQELDRTRQLRDRLDQLEKQIRQAQGNTDGQLSKLQEQYQNEMRQARGSLGPMQGTPRDGMGNSTPERQEYSQSAPGTESFKQDRSGWELLRKDLNRALEQHDAAVSRRLAGKIADARLSAGGSDRVPEEYRQFIARYYESLAKVPK